MSLQDKLRELFLLDQQVRGLRQRMDAALARLTNNQDRLRQAQRQHAELTDQHRRVRANAMTLEMQVKEAEDRVARLREQMNSVKTNKEYSALLVEVNTRKTDKSKLEDEALCELTRAEELAGRITQAQATLEDRQRMVVSAQGDVDACKAQIGQQLDDLVAQRAAAEQELPMAARALFNRAANTNEGQAMAAVVEESRRHREYSCGGCYISIPAERVNALMVHDDIVSCPSCGRILYLDPDLKSSMGIKQTHRR